MVYEQEEVNIWENLKSVAVAIAMQVYQWLLVKVNRLKLESRNKDLEKQLQENQHKTDLDTRSSSDVVRDAIERGRSDD